MMEYKYINDTEAALKRIKAECKMNKSKPKFQVRIGQSHQYSMVEGTIKQVDFILHNLDKETSSMREYSWIEKADSEVEVIVFRHGDVWVYVDIETERIEEEDEEE